MPAKKKRPLKETWKEPDKKPVTARSGGRGWPASKEQVDRIKRARAEREKEEHASAIVRKRLGEKSNASAPGLRKRDATQAKRLRLDEASRKEFTQLKREERLLESKKKRTLQEENRLIDIKKRLFELS